MSQDQVNLDAQTTKAKASAKAIVFMVVFIDLLGFGIVLPLLPLFADKYVKQGLGIDISPWVNGLVLGLLMSSFSLMQFLFAPLWGRVSDRIGRRPVLLVGLAGSVVFYALFGFASGLDETQPILALTLLFLARIGAGVSGATISTAQAVIADTTTMEKRKLGMALIGAAFGIGFTFGPLIGFAALRFFPNQAGSVGYVASALSALAFVLGVICLRETRQPTSPPAKRKWFDTQGFKEVISSPALGPIILVSFLTTMGFGGFESTLALMNDRILQLGKDSNFLIFAYVGLVLTLANGAYRGFAKRMSEESAMTLGTVIMGLGVTSLAGVNYLHDYHKESGFVLPGLLISLSLAVIGFALLTPSAQGLISRRADPDRQGEILGVNQSCMSLARILGPIFGLTFYKANPMLPFLLGGLLVLLMLPIVARIKKAGESVLANDK